MLYEIFISFFFFLIYFSGFYDIGAFNCAFSTSGTDPFQNLSVFPTCIFPAYGGTIGPEETQEVFPMSETFGPDFITVTDEDGNEFELELVDTLEHNGITYHALFPAVAEDEETGEPVDVDADDEEYGLVIMKTVEENGEELLSTLDSDEGRSKRFHNLFMERFEDEDE